ncbi:MAG: hypothetical protein AAFV80_19690, partial [Bacteroidota bacterium]
ELLTPTEVESKLCIIADSIVSFNPSTYEKQITFVRYYTGEIITSYLVKQRWIYDKSTHNLSTEVLGMTPLLNYENEKRALFWIPFDQKSKALDINDKDQIWVKYNVHPIQFNESELLSGDEFDTLKRLMIEAVKGKEIIPYKGFYNEYEKLEEDDWRIFLEGSVDTIITFHPETYKEQLNVVQNLPIELKEIAFLRTTQFWYFDQKRMTLNAKVVDWAPYVQVTSGYSKYYKPLFKIKIE